jgi:hypothetical protein
MMQALLVHTERVAAAAAKAAEGVLQPRTWYELRLSPSNTTGSSSSSSSTYDSTSLQPVQDGSWRAASQQTAVDDFLKLLPARWVLEDLMRSQPAAGCWVCTPLARPPDGCIVVP